VIVESFKINEEKLESRETCTWYAVTPEIEFHESVGLRAIPVAPLAGETSVGAGGGATIVVKFLSAENGPSPFALLALTRQ
jgi:hypothetical protein